MSAVGGRPGVRPGRGDALVARLRAGRWGPGAIGALAVLLGATSMQPLLDGGWWVPRTVLVVAAVTVAGCLARAFELPAPLQPLLQFGTLLLVLAMLFARDEARWGVIPGPSSLARLRELAAHGREVAASSFPPAPLDPGLLLLLVAGVGLAALAVDTLAAGLDLPGLTLVPMAALFAVPWVIQEGSAPGWTFVVVAAGWLAVVAALQGDRVRLWGGGARAGSPGTGLAIAVAATILAVLAGGLTGVRGSGAPVEIGVGSGSGNVRIDQLVSLRRSLVDNDERPVITMTTTALRPDYLRLAILELFTGEQWSAIGPNATGPQPPPDAPVPLGARRVEYRLDVGPVAGATVPSPSGSFAAVNDTTVVWDQRTSLPIRLDGTSIDGSRAILGVEQEAPTTAGLRAASTVPPTPEQVFSENLADPAPLTGPELPRLAREVTAGSGTPFDAAVALQHWFTTDGGFKYSTDIEGGSGEDALAVFLDERVGYCEQFAATMALMARSLGIPARVAVGFTQGRKAGNEWVVRGTDAHAWPELWMGTAGWVRFEPTPGAPTTTTPGYSTAGQAAGGPSAAPTQRSAAPSTGASSAPARVPQDSDAAGAQGSGAGLPLRWIALVLVPLLLLVPGMVRAMRRRRRLRSGDGESAHQEIVDTLIDLRLGEQGLTPRATLGIVTGLVVAPGSKDPVAAGQAVDRILRAVEWQRYGLPGRFGPTPGGTEAWSPTGLTTATGPADAQAQRTSAVLLAQRPGGTGGSQDSGPRAGALAGDVRIVRRALTHRAGWMRRAVAFAAPRSLVGPRG